MEDKRPQCTQPARSGKINRMPINEIWTNLRTFGYKGCQQFPLVKTRKNEGHSSEPTLHGGHEMALPQLPAVTQESYTII